MKNIGITLWTHDFIRPSVLIYLRDSETLVDDKNAEEIGDCSNKIIKTCRQKYVILISSLDNFIKDTRYKFCTMHSSPEIIRKKLVFCFLLFLFAQFLILVQFISFLTVSKFQLLKLLQVFISIFHQPFQKELNFVLVVLTLI